MNAESEREKMPSRTPTARRVGVIERPDTMSSDCIPVATERKSIQRKHSGFVMRGLTNSLPTVPSPQGRKLKNRKLSLSQPLLVTECADFAPRKTRRHSFSSPSDLPESVYEFLEAMPWLNETPDQFLQRLSVEVHVRPFRKGDIIIRKGDVGQAVFFVVRGTVEVISEDAEFVYAELTDGAILGEIAILLDIPRTCTVRAGTTCCLLTLKKETFRSFLQEEKSVKEKVMKQAQQRLANLQIKVDSGQLEAFGKEFALSSISETLIKIPLFHGCEKGFIYQLALGAELKLYQLGDTIIEEGGEGTEMFFLIRGVVEAVLKNGGGLRQTLQSGSFFGEESMLYNVPHRKSFKSVTSCDLLVISKLKMEVVMRDYPDIAEKIKQKAHSASLQNAQ